jgi:hypothetical protein
MPKRNKQNKRPKDVNLLAHPLVELSTEESEDSTVPGTVSMAVSQYMSKIGRKGGQIGGKRRLSTMTRKERSTIAKKAAKTRWKKRPANS